MVKNISLHRYSGKLQPKSVLEEYLRFKLKQNQAQQIRKAMVLPFKYGEKKLHSELNPD